MSLFLVGSSFLLSGASDLGPSRPSLSLADRLSAIGDETTTRAPQVHSSAISDELLHVVDLVHELPDFASSTNFYKKGRVPQCLLKHILIARRSTSHTHHPQDIPTSPLDDQDHHEDAHQLPYLRVPGRRRAFDPYPSTRYTDHRRRNSFKSRGGSRRKLQPRRCGSTPCSCCFSSHIVHNVSRHIIDVTRRTDDVSHVPCLNSGISDDKLSRCYPVGQPAHTRYETH
jgi:hypothetical protein